MKQKSKPSVEIIVVEQLPLQSEMIEGRLYVSREGARIKIMDKVLRFKLEK